VGGITNFINFSLLHNPVNVAHRGVSYTKPSRGKYLGGKNLISLLTMFTSRFSGWRGRKLETCKDTDRFLSTK
jgi:hypothetical protein